MAFQEVLLIKTRVDATEAKKMEDDLNRRYARVATRFGKGLVKVLAGGGILGAAFAAINRLLNPLQEIEERIKNLLGQSDSITDTAEKFGTTPEKFFKLQQLAHARGLDDAGLKDLLEKFKATQDLAKQEIADPSQGVHRSTALIKDFANDEDVANAFFHVMQRIGSISNKEQRASTENAIFGEKLTGGARKFAETDVQALSKQLGLENTDSLKKSFKNTENLSDLSRGLEAGRNVQNFLQQSQNLNPEIVKGLDQIQQAKDQQENNKISSIQNLKDAALAVEAIKGIADKALQGIERLIGYVAPLAPFLNSISQSRGARIGATDRGGK